MQVDLDSEKESLIQRFNLELRQEMKRLEDDLREKRREKEREFSQNLQNDIVQSETSTKSSTETSTTNIQSEVEKIRDDLKKDFAKDIQSLSETINLLRKELLPKDAVTREKSPENSILEDGAAMNNSKKVPDSNLRKSRSTLNLDSAMDSICESTPIGNLNIDKARE